MPNLKLTLACWDYDRTRPLMDGRVKPDGIDLDIEILRPRQAFQRMLDRQEFQVSELSLASYTALKGRGDCPFVAVPVALSKIFRHSCIYVRTGAGINTPQDLKGKRVGTSQWSSTGLVFMRGMLQHDYGVEAQDMHWFMGGLNAFVEPPLIPLDLPKDDQARFPLRRCDAGADVRGGRARRAAVALHPEAVSRRLAVDRAPVPELQGDRAGLLPPHADLPDHAYGGAARGCPSRASRGRRRASTRRSAGRATLAVDGLYDTDALRVALPWLIDHVEEARRVFGKDFWAYGLEPNRPTFEAIGRYVHEQGLSPRVVSADELFAPGVE